MNNELPLHAADSSVRDSRRARTEMAIDSLPPFIPDGTSFICTELADWIDALLEPGGAISKPNDSPKIEELAESLTWTSTSD